MTTTGAPSALSAGVPIALSAFVLVAVAFNAAKPADLRLAARAIADLYEDGDIVVLYPESRHTDLHALPPHVPSIAANNLPDELARFSRVIVLRARDDDPSPIRRTLHATATMSHVADVGGYVIEVHRFDEPTRLLVDLRTLLPEATTVMIPEDGEPIECPWIGDRFDCPDSDWTWVGATAQSFAGQSYPCVWSHPIEGAELEITFPSIPGTHIEGWYGLNDYAVSIPDGTPVRFDIRAGGENHRFRAHRQAGRRHVSVALPDDHDAGPVTFNISAARAGVRHFCWSLQAVERESQ